MVDRVNCIPSSSIRFRLTRLYGVSVPCSVSSKPSRPETNSTSRRFRRGSWKALTAMPTAMPTSVSDAPVPGEDPGAGVRHMGDGDAEEHDA